MGNVMFQSPMIWNFMDGMRVRKHSVMSIIKELPPPVLGRCVYRSYVF